MAVTRADVEHVAALARLQFDEAGLARIQDELNAILNHVDTLQRLETADDPPLAHPFAPTAPMRADECRASGLSEALLAIAPKRAGRFVAVPPVLE